MAVLLLACCWLYSKQTHVTALPAKITASSIQLSPTVHLIGTFDWQIDSSSAAVGAPWSRCLDIVWRAAGI
jgi:hypothetical protein